MVEGVHVSGTEITVICQLQSVASDMTDHIALYVKTTNVLSSIFKTRISQVLRRHCIDIIRQMKARLHSAHTHILNVRPIVSSVALTCLVLLTAINAQLKHETATHMIMELHKHSKKTSLCLEDCPRCKRDCSLGSLKHSDSTCYRHRDHNDCVGHSSIESVFEEAGAGGHSIAVRCARNFRGFVHSTLLQTMLQIDLQSADRVANGRFVQGHNVCHSHGLARGS